MGSPEGTTTFMESVNEPVIVPFYQEKGLTLLFAIKTTESPGQPLLGPLIDTIIDGSGFTIT